MPRYIDANVLDPFDYSIFDGQLSEDAIQGMETVLRCIDDIPTADVQEVRHGHWIETPTMFKCSKCNTRELLPSCFCPRCGAKMENGR